MKSRPSVDLGRAASVRVPKDYPWKVLSKLTEDLRHCVSEQDLQKITNVTRSRKLELLEELQDAWSPQSMCSSVSSLNEFRAKLQMSSLLKKYRFNSSSSMRKDAALKKFFEAEDNCHAFNTLGWLHVACPSDIVHGDVISHARKFISKAVGKLLPQTSRLRRWSRHGPGANLDCKYGFTSLYDKYENWPYSCSSGALGYARAAIEEDERWLGALEDSYRERFSVPKHAILNRESFWSNVFTIVDCNRVTFVPKNARTDRSIAIEPSMNLYLQLGVDGFIRRRLIRYGVNLDDQTKNQRLALDGSQNWESDESYVTLDLAAASDSVSTELVKQLFPEPWYNYLMDLRSPYGHVGDRSIFYSKISSMGNGYTFALESLIFTSLVYGVMKVIRGQFDRDAFAVFGDDIIVRKPEADLLIDILQCCGFQTNKEKSFIHGPFRESCGADYWSGAPVRPVFLSELPTKVFGIWNDVNRLRRYLFTHGLTWESQVCDLISGWIPLEFKDFQGPLSDTNFDSYMHIPRPNCRCRNGVWRFRRLVVRLNERKGRFNFHFRKLMASLRGSESYPLPWSPRSWGGSTIQTGGNVFTIPDSKSVKVSVSPTQAWYWPEQYNEQPSR